LGSSPDHCTWQDCDDTNHGQLERCANDVDDNCDGQVNEGCGRGGSSLFRKELQ